MSQNILLKRSAVPGKVPTTGDVPLGSLALNTADAKLFTKKSVGGVESIVEIGGVDVAAQGFAAGSASTPSIFFTDDSNTGLYNYTPDGLALSTGGVGQVFLDGSGRVGFGTSTLGVPVTIQADSGQASIRIVGRAADDTSYAEFTSSNQAVTYGFLRSGASYLAAGVGVTEALRLSSSGAFGIAGANYGTSGQVLTSNGSAAAPSWQTMSGPTVANDTTTNATYYPVFATATSGSFTTATVSSSKLTYNPSTGALSATSFSGTLAGSNVSGNISGNAANITAYTINQSVGTSNSVQFNSLGVGTAASGTAGEIRATNNVTAYYSDDRLKERLGPIENPVEKVCSLTGFYYQANDVAQSLGYTAKREVGLSAQEVERILPEIVAPAPIDDQYKTLHYERLIPLLVEAIKEQQRQIELLKEKVG